MTKTELIMLLADRVKQTQKTVGEVLEGFRELLIETLSEDDEKLTFSGLGTFEVRTRPSRKGKNPRTGEEIVIPEQKTVGFIPSKAMKDALNEQ